MEVPQSVRPPREAYRYWPSGEHVCKGFEKHSQRFIFANQQFTPFESEKLSRLKSALQTQQVQLPSNWDDGVLLRLIYGTHWKTRNAVTAVVKHIEWRRSSIPPDYRMLYSQVLPLLQSGCLYIHGRDSRYRPCMVMCYPKFNFREVRTMQHTIDEYMPLIAFFLDYIIDNMFLPGQIENWVAITDMGNMSLSDMPLTVSAIQHIRKLLETLTNNYKCRLAFNYIVNAPTSVHIIWTIVKKFLDKDTVEKITLTGKAVDKNLLKEFNPGQVETRYGGSAPNLEQFWPPVIPETPFEAPGQSPGALLSDHSSYPVQAEPTPVNVYEPQEPIHREDPEIVIQEIVAIQASSSTKESGSENVPDPPLKLEVPLSQEYLQESPEESVEIPPLRLSEHSNRDEHATTLEGAISPSYSCFGWPKCSPRTATCVLF